jgi:hypothetical protein
MATTSQGFPYPVGTDAPDVPLWIRNLADKLNVRGSLVATPSSGLMVITLPVGVFTVKPSVVATNGDTVAQSRIFIEVDYASSTTAIVALIIKNYAGAAITSPTRVNWIAYGP